MRGRRGQWVEECTFPGAPDGAEGVRVLVPPPVGEPGSEGSSRIYTPTTEKEGRTLLRTAISLLYLETALREAEIHYANSQHEIALAQIAWLAELVLVPGVHKGARECAQDSGLIGQALESAQEFHAVRAKVFVLLRRLAAGLDYYGNVSNFVPLLGRAFYAGVLDTMIERSRIVESAYIKYRDARNDWTTARTEISRGLDGQASLLGVLRDRTDKVASVETALVRDIESLSVSYDPAWRRLVAAGQDFKDAVQRESKGCEFKDVVMAIGTIAVAVSTAGAGAGVAMAAWKAYDKFNKIKDDPEDKLGDLAETKYKIEKVAEVGKGVGEIAKGVGQIIDLVNRPDRPNVNLPSDAAKLLMSRKDLQATVEPFRHLKEAGEYLRIVDEFIELVTTRNNKIVEYNALANARAEILADQSKAESEIARLRTELAQPNVQHLPEFASFMGRANAQNKRVLMQMLYHEHRAVEYWAGASSPFRVSSDSVDHLAQTHTDQYKAMVDGMENRGRSPELMTFADGVAKFSVMDDVGSFALDDFRRENKALFTLPIDRFDGLALVRFSNVRIALPGIKLKTSERGDDAIGVQLIHYGQATLTTLENKVLEFSHEPRSTYIFYRVSQDVTRAFDLGGDGETFIKLAVNGPWSIAVAPTDASRVDVSGVTDIILDFEGEFFSLRTVAPFTRALWAARTEAAAQQTSA